MCRCFPVNLVKFLMAHIWKNWRNGRDWRKTSEANLACLFSIKVSGSSLKAFSEQRYLKAVKLYHNEKKLSIKSEKERDQEKITKSFESESKSEYAVKLNS